MEDPRLVLMDEVAATFNDHEVATVHAMTRQLASQGRASSTSPTALMRCAPWPTASLVMREGTIKEEIRTP